MSIQMGREGEAADEMINRADGEIPSPFGRPAFTPPATPPEGGRMWDVAVAFGVWLVNLALTFIVPLIFVVGYVLLFNRAAIAGLGRGQLPPGAVMATLIGTFASQVLTLALCWVVVMMRDGQQSFLASLGWSWHPQFKWVHAVGLALLMLGIAAVLSKVLPHRETDLERLLRVSFAVRITVGLIATFGAPLVEEIVYRGILYTALERAGGRAAGVAVVTLLFTLVHVPQYWGSVATITAILLLSVVLTGLRAWTGRLLPCVATHFVFNGIQSLMIIFGPQTVPPPAPQPAVLLLRLLW